MVNLILRSLVAALPRCVSAVKSGAFFDEDENENENENEEDEKTPAELPHLTQLTQLTNQFTASNGVRTS